MVLTKVLANNLVSYVIVQTNLFALFTSLLNNELTITVSSNKGTEFKRIIKITDLINGNYIIYPSFIGLSKFEDGILDVTISGNLSSSLIKEHKCSFIDQDIKCKVAESVAKDNTESGILYYVLSQSQDCDCVCDDMYVIYCRLLKLINNGECNC